MEEAVYVVRTGTANLASVQAGLRRAGAEVEVGEDPRRVRDAARVVLPGVGSFAAAMERLDQRDLTPALQERLRAQRPTLAICLGLQVLALASEESPGVAGLGFLPVTVRRLPAGVSVPQLGWNRIRPTAGARLLREGHAYFANSYCVEEAPEGWAGATVEHGRPFVAALERKGLLACQFHPELSGPWGQALLRRWMEVSPC